MRKSNLEARRNARRQAREAIASARRERAKKLAILTMIMEEESDEEHARTSKVPKARTRSSPLERARLNWSSFKEGKVRAHSGPAGANRFWAQSPGKAGNSRPTHLAPVPGVMGGQQETSGRLSVWWFIRTAIDATLGIWRFRLPVEYSEEQTPTRL